MRKPRRRKLVRQDLENILAKYERRIQRCAEAAYKIRQVIETMDAQDKAKQTALQPPIVDLTETAAAVAGETIIDNAPIEEPKGEPNAM